MKKQVISDALWVDRGDYFVLRNGRIFKRNWEHTGKTREVKQSYNADGYLRFRYNGRLVMSHRFVAECFISNPDNLPFINHKSEFEKDNNNVFNLEWVDVKTNNNYGTRNKRISDGNTNGKQSKKVYQYDLSLKFVREWPSASEVQRQLGFLQGTISMCCRGERKTAYGYIWRYAE